ncbi:MAG: c-type cytochrome [Candidatus Binataceae bacterium]
MAIDRTACAEPAGKQDYLTDCAHCHGVDGKGGVPEMRAVPGYQTMDLTQLSKSNAGQFPRQEVFDAIDGRKRLPAHFIGDMPTWGLKYQQDRVSPESEEKIRQRISGLVEYVESIQAK